MSWYARLHDWSVRTPGEGGLRVVSGMPHDHRQERRVPSCVRQVSGRFTQGLLQFVVTILLPAGYQALGLWRTVLAPTRASRVGAAPSPRARARTSRSIQ